jgi:hypothetical protein
MIIDTGANINMTQYKKLLHEYQKINTPSKATASNGENTPGNWKGTMILSKVPAITIPNVLYVPKIRRTLHSADTFTRQVFEIKATDEYLLYITYTNRESMLTAYKSNGLYYLTPTRAPIGYG